MKKLFSEIMCAFMVCGIVTGCGTAASDQSRSAGTGTSQNSSVQEASVDLPKAGDIVSEEIDGQNVSFKMTEYPHLGIMLPVPEELTDTSKYTICLNGIDNTDRLENGIMEDISKTSIELSLKNGFFMYLSYEGDSQGIYVDKDGTCNVNSNMTLEKAKKQWVGSDSAFSFSTEPEIYNTDNGNTVVEFATPINKGYNLTGSDQLKNVKWTGTYSAIKNGHNIYTLILGQASKDSKFASEISRYMIEHTTYENVTPYKDNISLKDNKTSVRIGGKDVSFGYQNIDKIGLTVIDLKDEFLVPFDYGQNVSDDFWIAPSSDCYLEAYNVGTLSEDVLKQIKTGDELMNYFVQVGYFDDDKTQTPVTVANMKKFMKGDYYCFVFDMDKTITTSDGKYYYKGRAEYLSDGTNAKIVTWGIAKDQYKDTQENQELFDVIADHIYVGKDTDKS